jgi:precorrin-2/cobalt-factor-2 C20-methyltransferase
MKLGTLYGIGVGPGDPELISVRGATILATCPHVFVPKAKREKESVALNIARKHINHSAHVHELIFPMTNDRNELDKRWEESAHTVAEILRMGEDAAFLTLGDVFLYSTYTYLLRALRRVLPNVNVVTVPGITAFSAAAALAEFPVGEGKEVVTIVPTADDLEDVRAALSTGGTVVLMKIGKRLQAVLDLLEQAGTLNQSILVSHAGMESQRIETDLNNLRGADSEAGYLSIILVPGRRQKTS